MAACKHGRVGFCSACRGTTIECDWCGADQAADGWKRDRIGGVFCSKAHRDASTRAVKALRERCESAERGV
jgi:hypothetical protein